MRRLEWLGGIYVFSPDEEEDITNFILFLESIFNLGKAVIPFILIFVSFYLILRERDPLLSLITFTLAGFLGYSSFNLPIEEPLLPLLTGLFGLSALIISLQSHTPLIKQEITPIKSILPTKKEFIRATSASILAGPLSSFLPGIGSGHAALIGAEIIPQSRIPSKAKKIKREQL